MGFLISGALAAFGLDATRIQADRIFTEFQPDCLLTAFLRFSQAGRGQWRTLLGGTTLIGRVFSLLTINLFLPPSQLLVHPFLRFYANSPRSPALHYAVAKQVTVGLCCRFIFSPRREKHEIHWLNMELDLHAIGQPR